MQEKSPLISVSFSISFLNHQTSITTNISIPSLAMAIFVSGEMRFLFAKSEKSSSLNPFHFFAWPLKISFLFNMSSAKIILSSPGHFNSRASTFSYNFSAIFPSFHDKCQKSCFYQITKTFFRCQLKKLSQRSDLNRQPIAYEAIALPLSYAGAFKSQRRESNSRPLSYQESVLPLNYSGKILFFKNTKIPPIAKSAKKY